MLTLTAAVLPPLFVLGTEPALRKHHVCPPCSPALPPPCTGTPDGPMLTLTAAVLRLTEPFVSGYFKQNPNFKDLLSRHLNPTYYTTHASRLGSASNEPSLSGPRGTGGSSSSSSSRGRQVVTVAADPAAAAGQASFIAEVFFIAQRYMRVGLMPAVHR